MQCSAGEVGYVALILSTQNVVQSKYETESFLFFSFLNQMGKGKEAEEEVWMHNVLKEKGLKKTTEKRKEEEEDSLLQANEIGPCV